MSKPETMMIDEVKYIRADSVGQQPIIDSHIKIVIVDRGFVYVGIVAESPDFITMTHAKNIRVWGTTKGLGELVNGARPNTKLDEVGNIKIPMRAVISIISVEDGKWKLT